MARFKTTPVELVLCDDCGLHGHFSKGESGQSNEFCSKAGGLQALEKLLIVDEITRPQMVQMTRALSLTSLPMFDYEAVDIVLITCERISEERIRYGEALPGMN